MIVRIRTRFVLVVAALAVTTSMAAAPQVAVDTSAQSAPLGQVIPVDPQITVGTLPNGLRYYIRANKQPRNRAELRLVVNAGSILEDEDQRGLAHFVEHMAFNGTTHFPKQDVVAFMQAIGMRFGAHVNAHTSFDETVYQLQIPTDNPAVDRPVAARPRGLGAQRVVRSGGDRQGARRHPRRVAPGPRRRRAHAGRAVPGAAQGLALCRAAADRQARDPPHVHLRQAEEVLHRLVPAGPDGGDRGRRLRSARPSRR